MACRSSRRAGLMEVDEENCDDCRTWEEKLYWKCFQPLHFCQVLKPGSEFHKELVIPKKFAKNTRATLHLEVTLRGPSGASFLAIMTIRGGDVIFSDGWEQFVRAYSLQAGNILIFKYNGMSVFDVLIFDGENLCEKESAYFVQKCQYADPFAEHQRKRLLSEADIEEHHDNQFHKATKQAREGVGKDFVYKTLKRLKRSHVYRRFRMKKPVPRKRVSSSSRANPRKKVSFASSEKLADLSGEHGKSTVQNAASYQEPQKTATINGNCAAEPPNENNTRWTFATEFQQDAPLINGSWLIELENPSLETPQINRSETEASPLTGKETDGRCPNEATAQKIASARPRPEKALGSPEKQKTMVPSVRIQTEASSKKITSLCRLIRQLDATEAADGSPLGSADSSNRKDVSERGKVALEMACKQMTESSFVRVMRPNGVSRRFVVSVPAAWHKKHLSPKSQDVFLRLGDKTWLTMLWYSPSKGTGCISGEWKQFVEENQLEECDVCLFSFAGQTDGTAMLDVSIFRAAPPSQVVNERSTSS